MSDGARVLGGRYELGPVVGRGGMAEVYRGRDIRLERDVAVKTLRADLARDPTFQARFRREAQSAAALNHPSVVAVYDTGEDVVDGVALPYIVMEFVDGHTLREVLNDTQRLMPERALEFVAGILRALAYSHRMGIIHRDIKPGNVMVIGSGDIKVMDFGIARSLADTQATMTQTAQVIGTAQYLSPEQARGDKVDARSDLYATGCVLYELLTGRPPFSGDSPVSVAYQHVREDPIPPSHVNPDVPPALDAIVLKAMAKNADNRYQDADEMRADIERALGGRPVYATPVLDAQQTERIGAPTAATAVLTGRHGAQGGGPPPYPGDEDEPEEDRPNRKPVIITVVALLIVAALVGGFFAYNAYQQHQQDIAPVAIPDVRNQDQSVATAKLKSAGFTVKTEQDYSTKFDKGTVFKQSPPGGSKATKGSTVTITVSRGTETVVVPPLQGKSKDDAEQALKDAGLDVGKISHQTSDEDRNSVLSSDPAGGETVNKGSKVNLTLSSGAVTVPDVKGESEEQARSEIEAAHLKVKVTKVVDTSKEPGEVVAQSPDPDQKVARGTVVTITVVKASVSPTTPDPNPSDVQPSSP